MCYLLYTGNLRGINVYNMKRTILLIILNLTILTSNSQNNILKDTIIQLGDYNVSIKKTTENHCPGTPGAPQGSPGDTP